MERLRQDLRYAVRGLKRSPGFTAMPLVIAAAAMPALRAAGVDPLLALKAE